MKTEVVLKLHTILEKEKGGRLMKTEVVLKLI